MKSRVQCTVMYWRFSLFVISINTSLQYITWPKTKLTKCRLGWLMSVWRKPCRKIRNPCKKCLKAPLPVNATFATKSVSAFTSVSLFLSKYVLNYKNIKVSKTTSKYIIVIGNQNVTKVEEPILYYQLRHCRCYIYMNMYSTSILIFRALMLQ